WTIGRCRAFARPPADRASDARVANGEGSLHLTLDGRNGRTSAGADLALGVAPGLGGPAVGLRPGLGGPGAVRGPQPAAELPDGLAHGVDLGVHRRQSVGHVRPGRRATGRPPGLGTQLLVAGAQEAGRVALL